MKRIGPKRQGDVSPDLTSFSDIANLLIIFFILTTSLVRPFGRMMDMPSSAKPPTEQKQSDTPTVRLTTDRIVFSAGEKNEKKGTGSKPDPQGEGQKKPQKAKPATRQGQKPVAAPDTAIPATAAAEGAKRRRPRHRGGRRRSGGESKAES